MEEILYDKAIVGTSPLSLLEAAIEHEKGYKIAVFDQNDRIGGAWMVVDLFGMQFVENSPHVIFPDKRAYELIVKYLSCDLVPLKVQPRQCLWLSPTSRISAKIEQTYWYSFIRGWINFKTSQKSFGTRLKHLFKSVTSRSRRVPKNLRQDLSMYPRHGLGEWFESITEQFTKSGISMYLSTKVKFVEITQECAILTLDDDRKISVRKVILNRNYKSDVLNLNGENYEMDYQTTYSWHHTYILRNNNISGGFFHCMGLDKLELFNDITDYTPGLSEAFPGCRMVQFRTVSVPSPVKAKSSDFYIDLLKSHGLIGKDSELVEEHHFELTREQLSRPFMDKMKVLSGGKLDFKVVDDLSLAAAIEKHDTDSNNF